MDSFEWRTLLKIVRIMQPFSCDVNYSAVSSTYQPSSTACNTPTHAPLIILLTYITHSKCPKQIIQIN